MHVALPSFVSFFLMSSPTCDNDGSDRIGLMVEQNSDICVVIFIDLVRVEMGWDCARGWSGVMDQLIDLGWYLMPFRFWLLGLSWQYLIRTSDRLESYTTIRRTMWRRRR